MTNPLPRFYEAVSVEKEVPKVAGQYGVIYLTGVHGTRYYSHDLGKWEDDSLVQCWLRPLDPDEARKRECEFAEWLRVRFQNSPLEFDNYWEDMEGFPNNTGKTYTTADLHELWEKERNEND